MNRKATFIVMLCFYFIIGCAAMYIYHFNKSAIEEAPVITKISSNDSVPTVSKLDAPIADSDENEDNLVDDTDTLDSDESDDTESDVTDELKSAEELFGDEPQVDSEPTMKEEYVFKAIHKSGRLFIRQEPSTESEQLGFLIYGQSGDVLEDLDEWVKVDYNGTIGYVSKEYLEITPKNEESYVIEE